MRLGFNTGRKPQGSFRLRDMILIRSTKISWNVGSWIIPSPLSRRSPFFGQCSPDIQMVDREDLRDKDCNSKEIIDHHFEPILVVNGYGSVRLTEFLWPFYGQRLYVESCKIMTLLRSSIHVLFWYFRSPTKNGFESRYRGTERASYENPAIMGYPRMALAWVYLNSSF